MTTAEVLQAVQAALLADTTLTDWCTAQFGSAPTVWLGVDDQHPPVETDYPLISIVGVEQIRGAAPRGSVDWRLSLGVGVVNETLVSAGAGRTYTGMHQAETLRELAEDALYRARLSGVAVGIDSNGESSSESYHPLYVSYTTVLISGLKSTRRGLPG